jgi:hypothetical protein
MIPLRPSGDGWMLYVGNRYEMVLVDKSAPLYLC